MSSETTSLAALNCVLVNAQNHQAIRFLFSHSEKSLPQFAAIMYSRAGYIFPTIFSGTIMLSISIILTFALLSMLFLMGLLAFRFIIFYMKNLDHRPLKKFPKVGIILPLRGSDPYLKRCLIALMNQQYPDFVMQIIIDNPEDPAKVIVEEVMNQFPTSKIHIDFLNDFTETCCLKDCALRQAYLKLPPECEVIILVDADAYPFPGWIEELVAGLEDPDAGVACGVRWFSPVNPSLGNLVRHVWNAGAFLQMYQFQIGWGGAFAMKKEAFEKAEIYHHWGKALFDDTYATDLILQKGYQFKMLPRVTMINEEEIDLKSCISFIARQLLNTRLYHRAWSSVFWYGLSAFVITLSCMIFVPIAYLNGQYFSGSIVLASLFLYFVIQAGILWVGDMVINTAQQAQNKPGVQFSPWYLPVAVLLALLIHPFCLYKAMVTNEVTWRGITYRFKGPNDIKRLNYEPYTNIGNSATRSL